METVGVYLKKERESRNISLHEVSRLTKISELYLDFIEKDEFEKLPQGPYAKGYIASYSRLIGGNVDQALQLYESLNRKCLPTEAIQTEIPEADGRSPLPEKPNATERKISGPSPSGTMVSSPNTGLFNLMAKCVSLKAAFPSPKSIFIHLKKISSSLCAFNSKQKVKTISSAAPVASTRTGGGALSITTFSVQSIIPFFRKIASGVRIPRWLTDRRIWLSVCVTFSGAGILVLAGFGFYHLFIYEQTPVSIVELQKLPNKENKETPPLPAMGAEKPVLPSTSDNAPLPSDSSVAAPRQPLNPEMPTGTSLKAAQAGTPLSGSLSTAENEASRVPTADEESRVLSDPGRLTGGPSTAPTAVDAGLSVLQASVCSAIKNRMPTGVDTAFPSSVPRVYVWNAIEAQQVPSKIRHIYYFKGRIISDVTLEVRSPYWRTWSFKYMATDRYRGEWRVDIATTGGKVLRRLFFEVR